ncbi:hypothetical protein WICMUC_001061 [Wickerhamomyces mucosus]|uniref:Histone-binding protein RBBP4-like N-terminal domain-containing protein n=1 Tax=Wickerhamomyces mucosus TaxID=1378264 RepID=A0A9P8THT5_9ASCO|nr:hypothetical protein WICMUC_001061 [Wickerhamomyces mucosus]
MSKVSFNETTDTPPVEQEKELTIEEEYKLWKKNCPFMYEFVSEALLKWPSLSVQWLPDPITNTSNGIDQRLLLGTFTSNDDIEYLKIASTTLPKKLLSNKGKEPEESNEKINSALKITKKFKHETEVNRARYNPLSPSVTAAIGGSGDVSLYNIEGDSKQKPIVLKYHTENGDALAWNSLIKDQLLTGSNDKTVALWDTNSTSAPLKVFKDHSDLVNDVQWHEKNGNIFASASEDKTIKFYDTRDYHLTNTIVRESAINRISFSPFSSNLFAVGLVNSNIELYDVRNTGKVLHTIMGHSGAVTALEWDPIHDGILASGSDDRRVLLWDIKKIGEEQIQEDEDDGAPELFMMHAGHTSAITDLSFNPSIPFTLATCAENNYVQVWKINKTLSDEYYGAEENVDYSTLE